MLLRGCEVEEGILAQGDLTMSVNESLERGYPTFGSGRSHSTKMGHRPRNCLPYSKMDALQLSSHCMWAAQLPPLSTACTTCATQSPIPYCTHNVSRSSPRHTCFSQPNSTGSSAPHNLMPCGGGRMPSILPAMCTSHLQCRQHDSFLCSASS